MSDMTKVGNSDLAWLAAQTMPCSRDNLQDKRFPNIARYHLLHCDCRGTGQVARIPGLRTECPECNGQGGFTERIGPSDVEQYACPTCMGTKQDLVSEDMAFRVVMEWYAKQSILIRMARTAAGERFAKVGSSDLAYGETAQAALFTAARQWLEALTLEQQAELRQKDLMLELLAERRRQDDKWGGPNHDDQWTPFDWHEMIADYNAWARRMAAMGNLVKARRRYIQVAALAVAAVEALDRQVLLEAAGIERPRKASHE